MMKSQDSQSAAFRPQDFAPEISRTDLELASRNRGMPLEGLRYDRTPVGLHYLLNHFDVPHVDPKSFRLHVDGTVQRPLELSLGDIQRRMRTSRTVTMECAGHGRAFMQPRRISQPWLHGAVGTADWTGAPLSAILQEAGLRDETVELVFTGRDQGCQGGEEQFYQYSLSLDEATNGNAMLAYEMNGAPLQPQHGFPLRLLVPGWYGMVSVKWLDRIEAVSSPFEGYQNRSYRVRQSPDDPGRQVERIQVRSLMIPPGFPDAWSRRRILKRSHDSEPVTLSGRAWAGPVSIARVEVSTDGGDRWVDAQLQDPVSEFAWRGWTFPWPPQPGRATLLVRATDAQGNRQPLEIPWNYEGLCNNCVQRIEVDVE